MCLPVRRKNDRKFFLCDSLNGKEFFRVCIKYFKRTGTEPVYNNFRRLGADPFNNAGTQILADAVFRVRYYLVIIFDGKLQPLFPLAQLPVSSYSITSPFGR